MTITHRCSLRCFCHLLKIFFGDADRGIIIISYIRSQMNKGSSGMPGTQMTFQFRVIYIKDKGAYIPT